MAAVAVTTFDETLVRLSTTTGATVAHYGRLYQVGEITLDTLRAVSESAIRVAATQGASYGQLAYTQLADAISGLPPAVLADMGTTINNNKSTIIGKSLDTVLGDLDDDTLLQRLERIGANIPITAVHDSYGDALRADERVVGWQRGIESGGACELCQWWARDGRIWPQRHPMPTHPGCRCQQIPTYTGAPPAETDYTQRLDRAILASQRTEIDQAYLDYVNEFRRLQRLRAIDWRRQPSEGIPDYVRFMDL